MQNKKGLSTVVTTLIIILLVLVAVGIIWGVVNNLLSKSEGTIESSTKCLDLDVRAIKVLNVSAMNGDEPVNYSITLHRKGIGDNEYVYAKLVIFSAIDNSPVKDFVSGDGTLLGLSPLDTLTGYLNDTVANATKIEVTPYYLDENGIEKICSGTNTFNF